MLLRHKKFSYLPRIIEQSRNKNADFFFNLGNGLLSMQQKESSLHAFAKASDLNPEQTKAWTAQINLTKTENNSAQVEAILTKWFLKTSNYAVVVNMLMQLHETFFSSDQIITYIKNLHAQHLTTPETLGLLVDIYFEKKEYQQGLELLKKAEAFPLKSTAQTSVFFNKAYGHWMLNQKKDALPFLQQALNLTPDHTESGNLLALYYLETEKNLDEAEKLINTVLEKEPHNPAFLTTKQHVMQKKQEQIRNYVQAPTDQKRIKKNI
jgi:tetratricopeptide (TPR) repeat protein